MRANNSSENIDCEVKERNETTDAGRQGVKKKKSDIFLHVFARQWVQRKGGISQKGKDN